MSNRRSRTSSRLGPKATLSAEVGDESLIRNHPNHKAGNCCQPEHLSNLRQAPERPRKTREGCRATPGAMRFSVACLVVWPELWLTRGDPRLGKRPFIESIALSPYTPISPAALLAYAIPLSSSLSCSSNIYSTQTLAHRPLVARRFTIANLPSNRYILISRITSQLPTARSSYLWVVSNRHLPLEDLRISPIDRLTAGPYPKRQGFSRPLRYCSRHFYSSNPRNRRRRSIRVSSRSRDHQHRRQIFNNQSNPPFHALTASTPVHHHIST